MALPRTLDLPTLGLVARGIARRDELWRPHAVADPDALGRHTLIAEPHLTVVLMTWMPGQSTGFHDHDTAGAVTLVQGALLEERLRFADAPLRAEHHAGDGLAFGPDDIHRLSHLEGEPALTIHAYAGPVRRTGSYVEGPDGVLTRRAADLLVGV